MIGFPLCTSALNAALVNGTLGHADEVDASEGDDRGNHILAAVMGEALTAGQFAGASGQEVWHSFEVTLSVRPSSLIWNG